MYRSFILSALSVAVLSGCGGSGDSDPTTTTPEPSGKTLTITAVYRDACGNETPARDAALIIHNADYSNKTTVYADASGVLSYQSNNAKETFSLITYGQQAIDGVSPINVITLTQHPVMDVKTLSTSTADNSACECITSDLDVEFPLRPNDQPTVWLSGINSYSTYSSRGIGHFLNLYQCKKKDEPWPDISVVGKFNYPNEAFGVIVDDLHQQQTSVQAILEGMPLQINSEMPNRMATTYIDNNRQLINVTYDREAVYGFGLDKVDYYRVDAYDFEFYGGQLGFDEMLTLSVSSQRTTDLQHIFDLPKMTVDLEEIVNVLDFGSGDYDFSNTNFADYVSIQTTATSNNRELFTWYMTAPVSGQSPDIGNIDLSEFIDESKLDLLVDTLTLKTSVVGYGGIEGYQDYLISRLGEDLYNDPKWRDYRFTLLEVTANYADLVGVSSKPMMATISETIN